MKRLPRIINPMDISLLLERSNIKKFESPQIIGIYFLVHNNIVIYVGQSIDIYTRISSHKNKKEFTSAFYIECPEEELKCTEDYYIIALNPPLNKTHELAKHYNKYKINIRDYNKAKKLEKNKGKHIPFPIRINVPNDRF